MPSAKHMRWRTVAPGALGPGGNDVRDDEGGYGHCPEEVEMPVEGVGRCGHVIAAAVGSPRWLARHDSTDSNV